jgi:hypothetical protein
MVTRGGLASFCVPCALVAVVGCASAPPGTTPAPPPLVAPFVATAVEPVSSEVVMGRLMAWLPGDYRNEAPIGAERSDDAAAHLQTHIRAVDLPQLGQSVLYVEEYRGRAAPRLERVRFYVFESARDGTAVKMLVLNPKRPERFSGARHDLSRLQALTSDDLTVDRPGCALQFSVFASGAIAGRMQHRACDFAGQWVDYELQVSAQNHWVCYSRRSLVDDRLMWQFVPSQPCVLMTRGAAR